jgi:hypothetical protein
VWRELLRAMGCLLAVCMLPLAFFASMFRFDSYDEYQCVLQTDMKIGLFSAVSVALMFVPPAGLNTLRWRIGLGFASLIAWVVVSGGLAYSHYRQYVIRSTPPSAELPLIVLWL